MTDTVPASIGPLDGGGWIDGVCNPSDASALVDDAIAALSEFSPNANRADAIVLLDLWDRGRELTASQVVAVLAHFRPADMRPEHDGFSEAEGSGSIAG